jgi:AraC-like DNA-binding protein
MTAMVRAQAVRAYRKLVAGLGGDAARLLRKSKVKASALDQPAGLIGFGGMIQLLERSARELDCPDFGLRLAEHQDIGILGPLAVAMRYSPTLGDAARCASRYLYVHNPAIGFTVREQQRGDEVPLVWEVLVEHVPDCPQMVEHGIGVAYRILTMLSEGRSRPLKIWLPHRPVAPPATYRTHFAVPMVFEADRTAMTVQRRDLDLPLSERNDELHNLAISYLDVQFPERRTSVRVQVRNVVERLLGTGSCTYEQAADALAMHPRTLQRRLRDEGTAFDEIKDDARRDLAERYLAHPEVPLTQVTALLDYHEQSALTRSCQRWFHATPRALRARLSSGAPALSLA